MCICNSILFYRFLIFFDGVVLKMLTGGQISLTRELGVRNIFLDGKNDDQPDTVNIKTTFVVPMTTQLIILDQQKVVEDLLPVSTPFFSEAIVFPAFFAHKDGGDDPVRLGMFASFELAIRLIVFYISCMPAMLFGIGKDSVRGAFHGIAMMRKFVKERSVKKEEKQMSDTKSLMLLSSFGIGWSDSICVRIPASKLLERMDHALFGIQNPIRHYLLWCFRVIIMAWLWLIILMINVGAGEWTGIVVALMILIQCVISGFVARSLRYFVRSPTRYLLAAILCGPLAAFSMLLEFFETVAYLVTGILFVRKLQTFTRV
jgi:hypothetical protein